jgi:CO/xanthine dehydrogenase FAD-binding subunit
MTAARVVAEGGRIRHAAVAVGACSAVAVRLAPLEDALRGAPVAGAPDLVTPDLVLPAIAPISDVRADAAYRGEAAVELVRRALAAAAPAREAA